MKYEIKEYHTVHEITLKLKYINDTTLVQDIYIYIDT